MCVSFQHLLSYTLCCDQIVLRISSTDRDALQTKLLVYLQTEQYGKALDLIDKSPAQGSLEEKQFEKAYALYRLKREEQAQGILNEVKSKADTTETDEMVERGLMHLEAQLVCDKIYHSLCS